jgi:cytochrome c
MKIPWVVLAVAVCFAFGVFRAEARLPEQQRSESGLSPEALAQRTGCLDCHSVDKKKVGPAYRDVAAKYRNDAGARATLAKKIKTGGKGNWTEITGGKGMPPHSALLSEAEISQLVDWILSR